MYLNPYKKIKELKKKIERNDMTIRNNDKLIHIMNEGYYEATNTIKNLQRELETATCTINKLTREVDFCGELCRENSYLREQNILLINKTFLQKLWDLLTHEIF